MSSWWYSWGGKFVLVNRTGRQWVNYNFFTAAFLIFRVVTHHSTTPSRCAWNFLRYWLVLATNMCKWAICSITATLGLLATNSWNNVAKATFFCYVVVWQRAATLCVTAGLATWHHTFLAAKICLRIVTHVSAAFGIFTVGSISAKEKIQVKRMLGG